MMTNFSRPDSPATPRAYLKRAAFFVGGLLLLYLALQLMPDAAPASDVVADEAGTVAQSLSRQRGPSFGPGMLLAALILIAGTIFALSLRRKASASPRQQFIRTIADMPITQDQRIRLVRVQDEVLLLGITSRSISVLQVYAADDFDRDAHEDGGHPVSPAFADMLRQATDRYRNLPRN